MPATRDAFYAWVLDYERERMEKTEGGTKLVEQLFVDWRRWFPGPTASLADPIMALMMGEQLRRTFDVPDPSPAVRLLGPAAIRGYIGVQGVRPHRAGRSWSDGFVDAYGGHPVTIAEYGHRGSARASVG